MSGEGRALITGVGGQDGSLLAELLLSHSYEVFGILRSVPEGYRNLDGVRDRIAFLDADLEDETSLRSAVREARPTEVYHLASESFVPASWNEPVRTLSTASTAVAGLLEAVRSEAPSARVFYAASNELFGGAEESPQKETTPVAPISPYGVAKAVGHFMTGVYRRRYGLHASSGILFNHESPRRPAHFVTRKVTRAVAAISLGQEQELVLGALDARRDWGYAGDYVRGMWLMLQQDEPDDYVLATGESHSVEELVELAFRAVDLDWREHVRADESLERGSAELHDVVGDSSKARFRLGWEPELSFPELVRLMVEADLRELQAAPA